MRNIIWCTMSLNDENVITHPVDKSIIFKSFLFKKPVKELLKDEKFSYRSMAELYRNRMREMIQAARGINPNIVINDAHKWKLFMHLWVVHGIRSQIRLPGAQRNLTNTVPNDWSDDTTCWIGGLIHRTKDYHLMISYLESNSQFSVQVMDVSCPRIVETITVSEMPQNLDSNDLVEVDDDLRRIEFVMWRLALWIQTMIYFRSHNKAYSRRPYGLSSIGSDHRNRRFESSYSATHS